MSADDTQLPGWVSIVGVAWAIDEAPCPADLLSTLVVIARRAGADGKNSWQSVPTIARKTGKSESQIRRELPRLKKLNLIAEGDQSKVKKIPGGARPVVYDLVLTNRGDKPAKQSPNPTGKKKADSGPSTDASPSTGATPGMDARSEVAPVLGQGSHGCVVSPSTGATQRRREEDLEESFEEEQDQKLNPLPVEQNPNAQAVAGEEQGKAAEVVDQVAEQAHRLAMTYRDKISSAQFGMLRGHLATALTNGWTYPGLAALLAEDHHRLGATTDGTIGPGLIGRVKNNPTPPPPLDPSLRVPCPIGGHYNYEADPPEQYRALRCSPCWSEVRRGEDPFRGQHERRHPEWTKVYGFDPPAIELERTLTDDDRAAIAAQLAALTASWGDDEPADQVETEVPQ